MRGQLIPLCRAQFLALMGVLMIATASLVLVATSAADRPVPASARFGVFSRPAVVDVQLSAGFSQASARTRGDFSRIRALGTRLGRFQSQLVAYPANDDRNVCLALEGISAVDPAMLYCYQPTPEKHFNAIALEGATNHNFGVQLFGVAYDDVIVMPAQVAGEWHDVPMNQNSFYLDLPGVRHAQVGVVEARLTDGSTQTHDIQTGQ